LVKGHSMQHMRDWLYILTLNLPVDKNHDKNPDHGSGIHKDGDHNAEEHDHGGDDPVNPWDHDHGTDGGNVPHTHDGING